MTWRVAATAAAALAMTVAACGGDGATPAKPGTGDAATPAKAGVGQAPWTQAAERACAGAKPELARMRDLGAAIGNVDAFTPGLVDVLREVERAAGAAPDPAPREAAAASRRAGERVAAAVDDRELGEIASAARGLQQALDRARETFEAAGAKCDAGLQGRDVDGLVAPFYLHRLEAIHRGIARTFRATTRTFTTPEGFLRALDREDRTLTRALRRVPSEPVPRLVRRVVRRYLGAVAAYRRLARDTAAAMRQGRAGQQAITRLNRAQRRLFDAAIDFSTAI